MFSYEPRALILIQLLDFYDFDTTFDKWHSNTDQFDTFMFLLRQQYFVLVIGSSKVSSSIFRIFLFLYWKT